MKEGNCGSLFLKGIEPMTIGMKGEMTRPSPEGRETTGALSDGVNLPVVELNR